MLTFKQLMEETIHAKDTVVTFPHKGKMKTGKVVRHEKGGPKLAPHYVISHGEAESAKVPPHKVEKYGIFNEVYDPKFKRATKTDTAYTGQINGKTFVVPHSFHGHSDILHGIKTTPMRHAIVTSAIHVQHNNPNLTPEEHTRVHSHIKDIHGGQETPESVTKHFGGANAVVNSLKEEKRVPNPYKVGDKVQLHPEALKHHAQSVPAHAGYSKEGFAWREHLGKLEGHVGTVSRVFPGSGHTNVDFHSGTIGIEHKSLVPHTVKEEFDYPDPGPRPLSRGPEAAHDYEKQQGEQDRRERDTKPATTKKARMNWHKNAGKLFREAITHGDEVTISHNYGVDSGKQGTVLHPNKVRTDGRGVPTDVQGAYKPVDHKKEHVVKLHSGSYAVVPKGSLTKLKEGTMKSFHDVAKHHQTKIAKQTLRMPDAMVGVMGGGSKEDARAHLKKVGWTDKMIHHHEHGPGDITMHHLDERTLTGAETDKKEELVHHMKKNIQGFKERYGKDAKSVMYATATADAKRLAEGVTEGQHDDHPSTYKYVGKHKASGLHVFDDQGKKELFVRHTASHGRHSGWGLKHQGHHYEYVRNLDEAAEQILELSKNTLKSYIKKAAPSLAIHSYMSGSNQRRGETAKKDVRGFFLKQGKESEVTSQKREKGITRAAERLEEATAPFMTTYKRNESANRHTANIVHLAKHFGDEADQAQAKFYADELKKHGHNKHHEAQYELHKKLWPKASAAHVYKEEVEPSHLQSFRYHKDQSIKHGLSPHKDKATRDSYSFHSGELLKRAAKMNKDEKDKLYKEEVVTEETQWQHGHLLHSDDQAHVLSAYVHRHTKEHKPQWANKPMENGTAYKPHHNTDKDWLKNTQFAVKKNGRLNMNVTHARSTPSLPLNEELHAYKVHHNGKHIDTVFYGHHEDPAEVKRSLVNHDSYHPDITVTKERKKKLAESPADVEYPSDQRNFHITKYKEHLAKGDKEKAEQHRKAAGLSETFNTVKKLLAEKFTRQHYQMIADVLKANPDAKKRQELANHHAQVFSKDNPRFSHERFHAAAGTKHEY